MLTKQLDAARLARLIEVGRSLLSELDLDVVLDQVLETARELTGARYAALGILDDERRELSQFIARGLDEETRSAIGDLPRGRGILGVLIDDPQPLRLSNVGGHPRSYGFPPGHPPMRSFLGVPITIRGQAWGNLYLTEKADGEEFTADDEHAVIVLADWAAIAIDNARLFRAAEQRRDELEHAVHRLEATAAIARAVGGETELGRVLELVAKRARALVEARDVLILLREGDELVVRVGAGDVSLLERPRIALAGATAGEALRAGRPLRVADVETGLHPPSAAVGVPDAATALLVPLVYRATPLGLLIAFDRLTGDSRFTDEDERLLEAFAVQAATAVAGAQSVQADRLRRSLEGAEEERRRWSRELHDETLQALAALRVLLSGAARLEDADALRDAVRRAAADVGEEIAGLRALIAELRPPALDHLGLEPALTSLADRVSSAGEVAVTTRIDLGGERVPEQVETTVYRIAQEALTNVVKHAGAHHAAIEIRRANGGISLVVRDDGVGIDTAHERDAGGFGLLGMRERVALAGGRLTIDRGEDGGTVVAASLPL
ncbi:MAG: sensor histidine kinase [Solirubrobacteraceae bacterium]